jgi:hypothetical protein
MRTRVSQWVVVVMVVALAACNRGERASVTGAYGEGVVSGQVTMAAGLGTSPAGVEVSLRGTGMTEGETKTAVRVDIKSSDFS